MKKLLCLIFSLLLIFQLSSCVKTPPYKAPETTGNDSGSIIGEKGFQFSEVPAFDGSLPYVVINGNVPYFTETQYTEKAFENYGDLDKHGRCTIAFANVCRELMPAEDRGSIGSVKPTGWHTVKYDCVDGNYLFNRCHLIGFQLTGENANVKNLITGTRYMNVQGMLPFEDMIADYVKETGNHVLYRVTPVFLDGELVARGVLMEAYSVEDKGDGISFNVYCYNNQPEIEIDYKTGESRYVGSGAEQTQSGSAAYVLNTSSKKFHLSSCSSVATIKDGNRQNYTGSREELILDGYSPCGSCKP